MYVSAINRKSTNRIESKIFQFLALSSIISTTPAFQELISATVAGWILNIICLCTCLFFFTRYSYLLDKVGWLYCIALFLIIPFHYGIPTVDNAIRESIRWINIILLFYLYKGRDFDTKLIVFSAFLFYIIECSCCIMEKLGHFYFIDYTSADKMQATSLEAYEYDFETFRSRGLLLHPLYNANVISIFMGYILVSTKLKRPVQIILLTLGLLAIWSCNSRACIAIWLLILLYRFFLYNMKIWHLLLGILSLCLIVPWLIEFIQKSNVLGRFNLDFTDGSSETRLIAFTLFYSYPWTFENIFIGLGDWIYYPLTDVALENGFLLNWAYWGWLIGSIKSFTEIYITYRCLSNYNLRNKLIIMAAIWGVASANNNMINISVLSFFFLANVAFKMNSNKSYETKKQYFLINSNNNI